MTKITLGRLPAVSGLFTSESVADGHPDKICDQISDAVLDAVLRRDPKARVAVETAIKDNAVWVFGELTGGLPLDVGSIVRSVLGGIGHADGRWGLDLERCVRCGRDCGGSSSAFVDPAAGGLVCRACGGARLLLREGRRARFLASTLGDDGALRDSGDAVAAIELIEATLAAHTQ